MKKIIISFFLICLVGFVNAATTTEIEAAKKETIRVAGAKEFQDKNAKTFSVFIKGFC